MSQQKHLEVFYRQNGGAPPEKERKISVEREQERFYDLVHVKLAPRKLKRVSMFNIALVIGCLIMLAIGSVVLAKPEFSALEKRDLAKFPEFSVESLFSGEFTRGIETYFSDTFPARDWFVGFSAVINENRGIRLDDVRILAPVDGKANANARPGKPTIQPPQPSKSGNQGDNAIVVGQTDGDNSEAPSRPASSDPEASNGNEMVGAISNGMFVYNGMAMSLFGGSNTNAQWYADVISAYQKDLPDVQVYNMIIPSAIEFYVPEAYRSLTSSQKDTIDLIYNTLAPKVKKVDAYSQLEAHKDEYIYFRTDHHWTGLGAYYAYVAFCGQAGLTPLKISDFTTRRIENFIGTMYAQTQDSTLLQTPDYVDYYLFDREYEAQVYPSGSPYSGRQHNLWGEYAVSPNCYSVFLQGDFPLISVKTDIKNGRKIMVVKESYGNAFAPFLINHYEEVHVVDQRYFERPVMQFIKDQGINEIIFANNAFAACTPYHIRCIEGLRTAHYSPPAAAAPQPPAESGAKASSEAASGSVDAARQSQAEKEQTPSATQKPSLKLPGTKGAKQSSKGGGTIKTVG